MDDLVGLEHDGSLDGGPQQAGGELDDTHLTITAQTFVRPSERSSDRVAGCAVPSSPTAR